MQVPAAPQEIGVGKRVDAAVYPGWKLSALLVTARDGGFCRTDDGQRYGRAEFDGPGGSLGRLRQSTRAGLRVREFAATSAGTSGNGHQESVADYATRILQWLVNHILKVGLIELQVVTDC